jgi:hypothetical protein
MSSNYGLSREQAAQILPQVAPIILGGLKRRAEQQNPQSVEDEIVRILRGGSQPPAHGGPPQPTGQGSGMRIDPSVIFGSQHGQAERVIAGRLGLTPEMTAKVLPMLIPVVLGALSKAGSAPRTGGPAQNSGIASILDQNGDGSIMDDLARMSGGGAKAGGCLSALLGGVLGGGRR